MAPNLLFETLIGKWEGSCRTWFEPGRLADESNVLGDFTEVLEGRFLRHTYHSMIKGTPRRGEEMIAYNSITKLFQCSWVDDFHMSDAMMFSQGNASSQGFIVLGKYDTDENQPQWGWKTDFELLDVDHLTITAFHVSPDGMEDRAVETTYRRVSNTESR